MASIIVALMVGGAVGYLIGVVRGRFDGIHETVGRFTQAAADLDEMDAMWRMIRHARAALDLERAHRRLARAERMAAHAGDRPSQSVTPGTGDAVPKDNAAPQTPEAPDA